MHYNDNDLFFNRHDKDQEGRTYVEVLQDITTRGPLLEEYHEGTETTNTDSENLKVVLDIKSPTTNEYGLRDKFNAIFEANNAEDKEFAIEEYNKVVSHFLDYSCS